MPTLSQASLQQAQQWESAGVKLPLHNLDAMRQATSSTPRWVHFGAGNIFRGFIAVLQQELLDQGLADTGIIAVDTFDFDVIQKIYRPYDNLSLQVIMHKDGSQDRRVAAGIAQSLVGSTDAAEDWAELCRIFRNPSLQMVSFTITEKGYGLRDMAGNLLKVVAEDIAAGPSHPRHAMSIVCALALERFQAGAAPLTFASMDNCSQNGSKLSAAVLEIAEAWAKQGMVPQAFVEYLSDPKQVAFPWSMIDRITPRPSEQVAKQLAADGIEGMNIVCTDKKTYIAPFVNAEAAQYLVVEDSFTNGRPPLEKAGVFFTDRHTVERTETMKVTTCLNPLHTALAVFGCLLGYDSIAAEMQDQLLCKLVERIGLIEGMPVVVNPGIIDPAAFVREVIEERLPNPYIPDAPQRIATDTSQKMSVRYGETIKSYLANNALDTASLVAIPLVAAGWLRYLLGVGDDGKAMALSADPMLEDLQKQLSGIEVGKPESAAGKLQGILSNPVLFGVDLYQAGLGSKVETMLAQMLAGPGAVRSTLETYLG